MNIVLKNNTIKNNNSPNTGFFSRDPVFFILKFKRGILVMLLTAGVVTATKVADIAKAADATKVAKIAKVATAETSLLANYGGIILAILGVLSMAGVVTTYATADDFSRGDKKTLIYATLSVISISAFVGLGVYLKHNVFMQ